jgi:hypothetical protein
VLYFASGKALKHKKVFYLGAFHRQQNNKNIGGEEFSLHILKSYTKDRYRDKKGRQHGKLNIKVRTILS